MIHAAIVEDDPMVAQINRQYLQQFGDFKIDGVFGNGRDAWEYVHENQPDLVILDVYMPIVSGIELLSRLRGENIKSAVIMVTAATEMSVVEEALRMGIVDYLVKPFSFQRFQEAIQKYLSKVNLLKSSTTVNQTMVDRLLNNKPVSFDPDHSELRKGLSQSTLAGLYSCLKEQADEKQTCESISARAGLSKVTVRRYLNYLIETGLVSSSIDYETGGRPRVLYQLKE
ncbi:response regulator [Caproiciproducens sp. NJN-50]|uniref:response regulator n=1 Tax=Acutalibacteraceae TaxID=3082771 RepID=UPI000FFE2EB7|nr:MULTISPECIES: response regulator [Acutalibacteraceae]QAT50548.1 response regulator [Caproiciproducens sp. NJN-50]